MTNEAVADLERHLLAEHRNGSRKPSADADELIPRSKSESPNHNSKLGRDGAPGFLLKQPGGFRREFLHSKADADGVPESARPSAWSKSLLESVRPLIRVGYFESVLGISESGERMQLRTSGEAGLAGTSVALLKGFLGSGVTFMPGVFGKGGWALASGSLVVAGALSFLCIRLLLACRDKVRKRNPGHNRETPDTPYLQTSDGSFSAVSKPNFASNYSLESSRRDLHNALLCTILESTIENWRKKNLAKTTPKR